MKIFFELIRVSIGCQNSLSRVPTVSEWQDVYQMVEKQSLVGICFNGVREQLANMPAALKNGLHSQSRYSNEMRLLINVVRNSKGNWMKLVLRVVCLKGRAWLNCMVH